MRRIDTVTFARYLDELYEERDELQDELNQLRDFLDMERGNPGPQQ